MVKNTAHENQLNRINGTLTKFKVNNDTDKIRIYLGTLLTKCLEALAENDYNKYSIAESVLNENLVRIGTNIDNFEEFYFNLKYDVTINFLKKLLDVEDVPILANPNPVEAVIITSEKAKAIKETWEFIHYSTTKKDIYEYWKREENYKAFENEAYTVLIGFYFVIIIDKANANGSYLETNYNFKIGLESELDVLEGFVTNNPDLITALTITERVILAENELDTSGNLEANYLFDSLEEDSIIYYNENESFLVLINDSFYKILNKTTGKSINFYIYHYQKDLNKTIKFLATFSDYCLGSSGTLKDFKIIEDEIVIVDPTEEPVENNVEEDVPTEEGVEKK